MTKVIFILSVVLAVACTFASANYCNLKSCRGKPHTACIFRSPYPSPRCRNVQAVGLTQDEKMRILNVHNQLRQRVASGQESRGSHGPQPPARNMQYLDWDNELEAIAQRWANQCDFKHDACRNVQRFQVGQNIGYKSTTDDVNTINIENIVSSWFNEVEEFNRNDVFRFRSIQAPNGKWIGHYTQLIWAETNKLGCGAMKYTDENGDNRLYLVCNYGPSGNFPGMPLYQVY